MRIFAHTRSFVIVMILGLGLMASCRSSRQPSVVVEPDSRLVAAVREDPIDAPATQPVQLVPITTPQLRSFPAGSSAASSRPNAPLQAVADAKDASTTLPTSEGFLNAVQYYDYAPGVVYTAVTSPGFVTTIGLQPGESVSAASAGDTTRWSVEAVESGSGDQRRTLLLVKPLKPFLETNLVVATDQRIYQIDLKSVDSPVYHTMISWNYPLGDGGILLQKRQRDAAGWDAVVADGFDLKSVNFNYAILKQKGEAPAWTPLRAFDDGAKSYIQFPPQMLVREAPPLFVLNLDGDAQVVNYRVKGDYYVVDRLFDRAELRLGEGPQQLVRIQRGQVRE